MRKVTFTILSIAAAGLMLLLAGCGRQVKIEQPAFIIDSTQATEPLVAAYSSFSAYDSMALVDPVKISKELTFKPADFDTIHAGGRVYYITDGDIAIDAQQLNYRLHKVNLKWDSLKTLYQQKPVQGQAEKCIVVRNTAGAIVRWLHFPISYTIDKKSFSAVQGGYEKIVQTSRQAAAEWSQICGVAFQYKDQMDTRSVEPGIDVDFVIRYQGADNGNFVALSFFPEDPAPRHVLFIYPSYWTTPYDATGVFRHEFGHVFGLRHEQLSNSPALPRLCRMPATPGINTIQVGANYDPISVMHYVCGSFGNYHLTFSTNDQIAFLQLYPKP